MHKEFSPERLDILAFAHAGATLSGHDTLQKYERLAQESQAPGPDLVVNWQATGEWRATVGNAGSAWLRLQAQATLPLVCQRCMGPMQLPLAVDRWFRFVADETIALAEDDEAEEDLLVMAHDFNLHALIEDELLMALPVVARHDQCPVQVPMAVADADFDAAETIRPNPFAMCHRMRSGNPASPRFLNATSWNAFERLLVPMPSM